MKDRNYIKQVIESCESVEQVETVRSWLKTLYHQNQLTDKGWRAVTEAILDQEFELIKKAGWSREYHCDFVEQNIAEN